MALSYNEAIHIAELFANEIVEKYQNRILAVFVIGSLGSDYYRPGQSDIDTTIITNFNRNELKKVTEEIETIADSYYKKYDVPKGFGAIVLNEEQLYPPYIADEELVLEILQLKVQSKLVWGCYDITKIPFPSKQALIDDAKQFQSWLDNARSNGFTIDSPVRLINSTLIILKRYLLIQHDIVEFNKFKVISTYLEKDPPLVNSKLFDYIEAKLHDIPYFVSNDEFTNLAKGYDELSKKINNIVLYEKEQ